MINIHQEHFDTLAEQHFNIVRAAFVRMNKLDIVSDKRIRKQSEIDEKIETRLKSKGVNYSLKEIITSKTEKLESMIQDSNCDFTNEESFKEMYNTFSRSSQANIGLRTNKQNSKKYNANTFVDQLGIRVCPLCNRNYIYNTIVKHKNNSDKIKRTCQIDHFYNKSSFPLLAMSFYNLVPVCSSCNHAKSDYELSMSPYSSDDLNNHFKFNFEIRFDQNQTKEFYNEQSISVLINQSPIIQKNIDILGLETLYEGHNDVVYDVLQKYKLYNETRRKELVNNFNGLFRDELEIKHLLFGDYGNKDNLHRKSLSKLTKDIIEQLDKAENLIIN